MDSFEAMRQLATTLGVAAPESSDDIYNVNFINSMNRAVKRVYRDMEKLHESNNVNKGSLTFRDPESNGGWQTLCKLNT